VSYGAEAWTLTKKEEQGLQIFERKIFRRIYGAKYENWDWKSRTNRELEEMSKEENIVKWIKEQRISWLGHFEKMEEDRMLQKDLHSRTGRDEKKGKTQEKMERGSRKRSSIDGSEKMQRFGGRYDKMEGHCSTDQSPQWAVVPMKEEGYLKKIKKQGNIYSPYLTLTDICVYIYIYIYIYKSSVPTSRRAGSFAVSLRIALFLLPRL